MNTLTATRAAQMVKWLSANHALLCALPSVPLHLHNAWIDARAHSKIMVDDLLRLSCIDVPVETPDPVRVVKFIPGCPVELTPAAWNDTLAGLAQARIGNKRAEPV